MPIPGSVVSWPASRGMSVSSVGESSPHPPSTRAQEARNEATTIPFTLGEGLFADGRPVTVSIVIFNLLQQQVAVPLALRHPAGDIEVRELEYQTPGYHEAFWNGLDGAGNQVASGVYFVRLTVNGQSQFKRMLVTK